MDLDEEWLMFCDDNKNISNNIKVINNNDKKVSENSFKKNSPKCSELYISTQTKIGYLSEKVNLKKIFWDIETIPYYKMSCGVLKKSIKINNLNKEEMLELDKKINDISNKDVAVKNIVLNHFEDPSSRKVKFKDVRKIIIGISTKDLVSSRKKEKGAFYNCFSLIIRFKYNEKFKEVHVKVFNTGKLEIPGIQNDDLLFVTLNYLISILQPFYKNKLTYDVEKLQTVLINSNFSCGFYINRNKLADVLKYQYNLDVIFDPCSYPGIQCKFYYNKNNKEQKGICNCEKKCCKKKKEKKNNKCSEISFMIFRTGSVLIVGNCTIDVLKIVYNYLKDILQNVYSKIAIEDAIIPKKKEKKKRKKTILVKVK